MSELCGSVACAQLGKLEAAVSRRRALAEMLTERLRGVDGIVTPWIADNAQHSYWKYCIRVSESLPPSAVIEIARLLKERGVVTVPRYIQKPAFMCEVFQQRRTFGTSGYPFTVARPDALDYRLERFPGATSALERILVVPWNERYTEEDVEFIADALTWAARMLSEVAVA
jgi:dTDP-4-amino-4,6-dideoxygalactose transaminase